MQADKLKVSPKDVKRLYWDSIKKANRKTAKKNRNEAVLEILKHHKNLGYNWLYRNLKAAFEKYESQKEMPIDRHKINSLSQYCHGSNYADNYTVFQGEGVEKTILSILEGSKWWFYYYYEEENGDEKREAIAKAVLIFGKGGNVTLNNIETDEDTSYTGKVTDYFERHLIFDFRTINTNRKPLRIHVYTGHGRVFNIMLGAFCNINQIGSMEAGTVILEKIDEEKIPNPQPSIIFKDSDAYNNIFEGIRRYFAHKAYNRVKAPARILSHNKLNEWLRNKAKLKRDRKSIGEEKTYQVVISTPSASLIDKTKAITHQDLDNISNHLVTYSRFSKNRIHYYGKDKHLPHICKVPHILLKKAKKRVLDTEHFILIYPQSCNSSTIAELSWAIDHKIPTAIFCHKKTDLPLIFQDEAGCRIYEYQTQADIMKYIEDYGVDLFWNWS